MLKQLYYGSLQDHMRTSRREMNQSYVLQQQQLMRMNIMRESQRMMLTQAETLVRLNQLRDDVIKTLPPKNVKVVIPTSNAALEETLSRSKQTQVTMDEEVEGKRAPPRSLKVSTSNSPKKISTADLEVVRNAGGSPSKAKAASKPSSPVPSLAPTSASDFSIQFSDAGDQFREMKKFFEGLDKNTIKKLQSKGLGEQLNKIFNTSYDLDEISKVTDAAKAASEIFDANAKQQLGLVPTPEVQYSTEQLGGSGLMRRHAKSSGAGLKRLRAKSGRFVKSKR